MVKTLLKRGKYTPARQYEATQTDLKQAETLPAIGAPPETTREVA